MTAFGEVYRNRRVLLTGHTGFKGSWLALWLKTLGAKVTGLALEPETTPSHWSLLDLDIDEKRVDIRDAETVADIVNSSPDGYLKRVGWCGWVKKFLKSSVVIYFLSLIDCNSKYAS